MPDAVKAKKHHLTQAEKDRAIFLTTQGVEPTDIARELTVDARQISGFIRSQINMGKIPDPSKTLPPSLETPMQNPPQAQEPFSPPPHVAAPAQAPQQPAFAPTPPYAQPFPQPTYVHAAPPASESSDGWTDGRPVVGHQDGFTNNAQQVRTVVEREIPADGVLGEIQGPITKTQLCEMYGEGYYKILRYEPGRSMPIEHKFKASAAFGPPRTPKRTNSQDSSFGAQRPGGRPWSSWRGEAERGEEDRGGARAFSQFSRPEPRMEDFARHSSAAADTNAVAATEAIKTMGRLHEQTINQLNKTRDTGPESFLKDLLQETTKSNDAKLTEESRRRDQDRKDEEARHDRRQIELDKAHQRELDRIKAETDGRLQAAAAERKMLMDLETQKLAVIREEHKNREEMMREEMKRNREEMKDALARSEKETRDSREAMGAQISEVEERANVRFQEHQAALEREHELKQKTLENAEKFQNQIFDLKREAIQQAGGDQLFQIIGTAIKEFSKGLERIVDLKKIEALTPEAQAAAVANRTIDGNVMGDMRRQAPEPAAPTQQHAAQPGAAPAPAAASPRGAQAAPVEESQSSTKEQQMELIIQESLDRPFAKQLVKQWAVNIKRNGNPAMFANAYMEWMRDPMDHEGRKATSLFAEFMASHTWEELLAIMIPKLDKEQVAVFHLPYAAVYYNGFSSMVCEQVREYWENFLTDRAAKRAAATAATSGGAAAAPATEAVPVEEGTR